MGWYDYRGYGYPPYVPVAQRRANAQREIAKLFKNGKKASPVSIEGRKITKTFWGNAWCKNLENYSDYENRLPRGQTYARNGSVVHLEIGKGLIKALVSGSELYEVKIEIGTLPKELWQSIKSQSAGKIGTLVELLQGKLSGAIMELVTSPQHGLFPKPKEIKMHCSCPDSAGLCKHLAAVMYGVGNRLDSKPELLFELRGVDHLELIEQAIPNTPVGVGAAAPGGKHALAASDLGDIFGIELGEESPLPAEAKPAGTRKGSKKSATKVQAKKTRKASSPPVAEKTALKSKPAKAVSSSAKAVKKKTTIAAAKKKTTVVAPVAPTPAATKKTSKKQAAVKSAVLATAIVAKPVPEKATAKATKAKKATPVKKVSRKG